MSLECLEALAAVAGALSRERAARRRREALLRTRKARVNVMWLDRLYRRASTQYALPVAMGRHLPVAGPRLNADGTSRLTP